MSVNLRNRLSLFILLATCTTLTTGANAQDLQEEINELRSRLDALEQLLATSQQQPPVVAVAPTPVPAPAPAPARTTSSSFNPAIGIIFQGQAWTSQRSGEDTAIQGFPAGGESGPITDGLALGETEINFSANVDDKFTAWLTLPVVIEDGEAGVEIEEAWIETTAMPAGLSTRVGKFFSGVGYLNSKHAHSWDFADQPLPYQSLMGSQYGDTGIQMNWLAPTDTYLQLSAEVLSGDAHPAGGADGSSAGAWSLYANTGGDIGRNSSWLAGLSFLRSDSAERPSGDEDDPLLFSGSSDTLIASAVWKWAPNGNWKLRNAVVQAEYIQQSNEGAYELLGNPDLAYNVDQSGWYIQGVYQPFPRWRFGARFDTLTTDDPGLAFVGSELEKLDDDPDRFSLMADWSNSEFSRLRLQYTVDSTGPETDNQLGIQYSFSIGAHGGHSF